MKRNINPARIACQVSLLGLIFFACFASARAQTTPPIIPHFDCAEPVYTNGVLTKLKAYFGYHNSTAATIVLGDGPNNFFTPNPSGAYSGQQTMNFLPGYHEKSFSILVNYPQTTSWIVQEIAATMNVNPANFCGTGAISYQGRLTLQNGTAVNSPQDLQFKFYESPTGGAAHPKVVVAEDVPVVNGIFTVQLDVNSIFRDNFKIGFLEIGIKRAGDANPFTILAPRQPLAAVPFALNAKSVSGGNVQLPLSLPNHLPNSIECNEAAEYGQMKFDAANNLLYICGTGNNGAPGWKSVALP